MIATPSSQSSSRLRLSDPASPADRRHATALLRSGDEFRALGRYRACVRIYFRLVERFGSLPEGRAAVRRLRRLAANLLFHGNDGAARLIGARLARAGHA